MEALDPLVITAVVITFMAVSITLAMPGLFIFSYLWSMSKREQNLWSRTVSDLKQERRERVRLQLLVDRLLKQLREAGVVPDLNSLYVTDEELIYHQMDQCFNESELQDLAYRLCVDYENLEGLTKRDKARSLSLYMERRDRMGELMAVLVGERPLVAW